MEISHIHLGKGIFVIIDVASPVYACESFKTWNFTYSFNEEPRCSDWEMFVSLYLVCVF